MKLMTTAGGIVPLVVQGTRQDVKHHFWKEDLKVSKTGSMAHCYDLRQFGVAEHVKHWIS